MLRVVITNRQKEVSLPRPRFAKAARISAGDRWERGELSLVVVSGDEMCALNREHTGRSGQTDVLAFCLEERHMPDDVVGEVIVNASLASMEAARRGIEPLDELTLYVVHGVLHLVGYDDDSPANRRKMYSREREVLAQLGVADIRQSARRGGRPDKS